MKPNSSITRVSIRPCFGNEHGARSPLGDPFAAHGGAQGTHSGFGGTSLFSHNIGSQGPYNQRSVRVPDSFVPATQGMHQACKNNHLSEVRRLLDQDDSLKDLGQDVFDGDTPLMYCAKNGSLECLKLLGERGADANRKNNRGDTAAHCAAYHGKLDCLRYLAEQCGADLTVKDKGGQTPLDKARNEGKQSCVEYLEAVMKNNPPTAISTTDAAQSNPVSIAASDAKRLPTPRTMSNKPITDWDENECITFLKNECRAGQYEEKFRSEGVRGDDLVGLTDTILRELGVELELHRNRILKGISGRMATAPAASRGGDAEDQPESRGTSATRQQQAKKKADEEAVSVNCGYRRKRALIVGIDEYLPELKITTLKNAVNDAKRLAASLKKLHFADEDVKVLINKDATRCAITDALYDFAEHDERDLIVIAFFCHGQKKKNGEKDCGFIVPADAKSHKPSQLYPVEEFEARVKAMKTHHILMLCDFCYSGTAVLRGDNDVPPPTNREPRTVVNHLTKYARWVISSGSADERVSDGNGNNSPFMEQVVTALKMDKFTAAQIYDYVMNNIGDDQTPLMNMLPKCSGHQMFLDLPALGDKLPALPDSPNLSHDDDEDVAKKN